MVAPFSMAYKLFIEALDNNCVAHKDLMKQINAKDFYTWRALWLQTQHGTMTEVVSIAERSVVKSLQFNQESPGQT